MPKDVYDEFDEEFYPNNPRDAINQYMGGSGPKRAGSALEQKIMDYINSGGSADEQPNDISESLTLPIELKDKFIEFFGLMSKERSVKVAELAKVIKVMIETLL